MKKRTRLGLSLSLLCTLVATMSCDRVTVETVAVDAAPSAEVVARVTGRGEAAAKVLMESLGTQLKGAMESGGPVAAITVCQQVAIPLTDSAGAEFEGVAIKRTTLKPRNPANVPDEMDRSVLEAMAAQSPPQPVIRWEDGVARFYHPLMIQEVCLKCHGDPTTFSKELAAILAEKYPLDAATGYTLGDLRGAIRVDIANP